MFFISVPLLPDAQYSLPLQVPVHPLCADSGVMFLLPESASVLVAKEGCPDLQAASSKLTPFAQFSVHPSGIPEE
jgi:hypothetical protein